MAANRKLGYLSIFFFVALCASLFINFVLIIAAFQRFGGVREPEPIPRFREILLERGTRRVDKIAQITVGRSALRSGLAIPWSTCAALQQACKTIALRQSCWKLHRRRSNGRRCEG